MLINVLIAQSGRTEHPDYFDYILPVDSPLPTDKGELLHIGSVALQVMFAGWGPMADLFYGVLVLLLENLETYQALTKEIREAFTSYDQITSSKKLMSLPYLHACIEETLRVLPSNLTGLPRISPGAIVNGKYIPKGVSTNFRIAYNLSTIHCAASPALYSNFSLFTSFILITDLCHFSDSCAILHLGFGATSGLLPRPAPLPATALAPCFPSVIRSGIRG